MAVLSALHTSGSSSTDSLLSSQSHDMHQSYYPDSISNRLLSASIKLLDSTVYLDKSPSPIISDLIPAKQQSRDLVPVRGYLSLILKKSIQIDQIKITLSGFNKKSLFLTNAHRILQSYKSDYQTIINDLLIYNKGNNNLDTLSIGQVQNFEFMFLIDNNLPQSLSHYFGTIEYKIDVEITSSSHTYNISKEFNTVDIMSLNKISYVDTSGLGNWRNLVYYQFVLSNTSFAIGESITLKLDIIPIIPFKIRLKSIKIYLYQTVSYNYISSKLEDSEKYIKEMYQQDKITLMEAPIGKLITSENYKSNFKINLEGLYTDERLRPIKIYPSTTSSITNFQTKHHLKIGITLQELQSTPSSPIISSANLNDDAIQSISLNPVTSTETIQFQTDFEEQHELNNLAIYELDKPSSEIEYIKSTAKLIPEVNLNNRKVELVSEKSINILKSESKFGMLAPPKYFSQSPSSAPILPNPIFTQRRLSTATSLINSRVRSPSVTSNVTSSTNGLLTPIASNESLESGYCYDNGMLNAESTTGVKSSILGSVFGSLIGKKKSVTSSAVEPPPYYDTYVDGPPKYVF